MHLRKCLGLHMLALLWLTSAAALAQCPGAQPPGRPADASAGLAPGDQVRMEIPGRPEMTTTTYIAADGTIRVPLAGAVQVKGLSPAQAARKVEQSLKDSQFLWNVHPMILMLEVPGPDSTAPWVFVVGNVTSPGRYALQPESTVLGILALAGGRADQDGNRVYLLRQDSEGRVERYPIDLSAPVPAAGASPPLATPDELHSGDCIYVPAPQQLYVSGEVRAPAPYRWERGMTVLRALAVAGGLTKGGSARRIEIKRRARDGRYVTLAARPDDPVEADDVITVKPADPF
jgi:polysaccharide export outer membrane protein